MGLYIYLGIFILLAIITVVAVFLKQDAIKSTLAGLGSALIMVIASRKTEFSADVVMPQHDTFGFPLEISRFEFVPTPDYIWVIILLSILACIAWFGYLHLELKRIEKSS